MVSGYAPGKPTAAPELPAAATMMITWRETHSYISRLGVKPGSRLLILGSGGNGFSFAVLVLVIGIPEPKIGDPVVAKDIGKR